MTDARINTLSDEDAARVLTNVVYQWLDRKGVEAFVVNQRFHAALQKQKLATPAWASRDAGRSSKKLGSAARVALAAIADGEDRPASLWVSAELDRIEGAKAQVFDPISLSIGGAILIGCILAARVKKIGSVEFYKGVPKELADVIKAAAPVIEKPL